MNQIPSIPGITIFGKKVQTSSWYCSMHCFLMKLKYPNLEVLLFSVISPSTQNTVRVFYELPELVGRGRPPRDNGSGFLYLVESYTLCLHSAIIPHCVWLHAIDFFFAMMLGSSTSLVVESYWFFCCMCTHILLMTLSIFLFAIWPILIIRMMHTFINFLPNYVNKTRSTGHTLKYIALLRYQWLILIQTAK